MRNFKETLAWYRENDTASEIGFNPNGMCLKVCRTARGIGPMYPDAKTAQDATPQSHRVSRIRDLRRGMVLYYDNPRDSNRFGHIVTMIGRVRGFNPDSLADVLVRTNSVVSGKLVVVRGDYFPRFWGDPFQFGATWLNGQVLDVPNPAKKQEPKKKTITQVAREVLNGEWGNGDVRVKRLTAAGYNPVEIQRRVNQLL